MFHELQIQWNPVLEDFALNSNETFSQEHVLLPVCSSIFFVTYLNISCEWVKYRANLHNFYEDLFIICVLLKFSFYNWTTNFCKEKFSLLLGLVFILYDNRMQFCNCIKFETHIQTNLEVNEDGLHCIQYESTMKNKTSEDKNKEVI